MEKKIKNFGFEKSPKLIKYNGETIEINPFLGTVEKSIIFDAFVDEIFSSTYGTRCSPLTFLQAKQAMALAIVDVCTDIQLISDDGDLLFDIDLFFKDELWQKIKVEVCYDDLIAELQEYLDLVKPSESFLKNIQSLGKVLEPAFSSLVESSLEKVEEDKKTEKISKTRKKKITSKNDSEKA